MRKTLLIVIVIMLVSSISFGQAPTVAAPTPTVNSANVISVFSDAYTDLVGTNFNPGWGQATVQSEVRIADNKTLKYANLNYQGTEFTPQNLATMNNVHFDYWTADVTTLTFFLINKTTGGAGEKSTPVTITKDSWQSVDIPLSTFTSQGFSIGDVFQFKFVGTGNGTIFLDNLYFSGGATTADNDASLSDLRIDGTSIANFSANVLSYSKELERGTTVVPTVTATCTQAAATFVITPATGIPGTTTVVVTAKDGTTKRTYSVIFTETINFPIDFELGTYSFIDFGGGAGTVIANPHSSGINTSAKVAQIVRSVPEPYAGSKIILPYKLDFTTKSIFSMKVYSPRVGVPVLFKLEGSVAPSEISATTTVANEWETLTWDFTGKPSNVYDNLVFMFDFGKVGDGTANSTFLFDDVNLTNGNVGLQELNNANSKVVVYPNPAENDLFIRSKTNLSKVAIYNVVGTQVKVYGNVLQSVDVSDLKTGVYMVKTTDVNGKTVTSKFIKK